MINRWLSKAEVSFQTVSKPQLSGQLIIFISLLIGGLDTTEQHRRLDHQTITVPDTSRANFHLGRTIVLPHQTPKRGRWHSSIDQ